MTTPQRSEPPASVPQVPPPAPPSPYLSADGEYFIMQDGLAKLKLTACGGSFWRGIIAAVCEVSWMREAEIQTDADEYARCKTHARAWRKWGAE